MKLSSPEARADAHEISRALFLLVLAFILAAFLRFPDRAAKPMHVDEATQAVKLHELMLGEYKYDPVDHHGPTLLYATLPVKWFSSAKTWEDLTESQLRLVPVLFGMGLLFMLLLVGDGLRPSELAWGAVAVAVSPVMVFYSRYYIMEMAMVCFTFGLIGCGWRFYLTRQTPWLVGAGVFMGLMHGTKETCVLQFAAIAAALLVVWITDLFTAGSGMGVVNRARKNPIKKSQFLALVGSAVLTSVLIFSQFFTKPSSVVDSITTYQKMLNRAGGQGHEKPFGYYFDLVWGEAMSGGPVKRAASVGGEGAGNPESGGRLPGDTGPIGAAAAGTGAGNSANPFSGDFWKYIPEKLGLKPSARIVWGERLCLILAFVGIIAAFTTKPARNQSRHLVRFLAVYSIVLFLIYSMVSYKTPWLVLGPWHPMLILAGVGASAITRLFDGRVARTIAGGLLLVGLMQAGLLAYRATRGAPNFAAHVRNPLNYSMTAADCLDWVAKIHRFAEVSGKGNQLAIVQADPLGGWPLPWYLSRKYPNYVWSGGSLDLMETADVVLCGPSFRPNLPESVKGPEGGQGAPEWREFSLTLHPSGRLAVFVRKAIWDAYVSKTWPDFPVQS